MVCICNNKKMFCLHIKKTTTKNLLRESNQYLFPVVQWWPFKGMSKSMVFLLFVWPFLAPFLINVVCARRR